MTRWSDCHAQHLKTGEDLNAILTSLKIQELTVVLISQSEQLAYLTPLGRQLAKFRSFYETRP